MRVLVLIRVGAVCGLVHGRQKRGVFGGLCLLGFSAGVFLLVDETLLDESIEVASDGVCTIQKPY